HLNLIHPVSVYLKNIASTRLPKIINKNNAKPIVSGCLFSQIFKGSSTFALLNLLFFNFDCIDKNLFPELLTIVFRL
ncbi:MAG TPA: hypothetical protein PLI56_04480, partial [Exilispira sp.]|nr:hypothetical protein [Exilispira sp.]